MGNGKVKFAGYRNGIMPKGMRNKRKRKVQQMRDQLAMEKRLQDQRQSAEERFNEDWTEYVSNNV